jgi:integrase
VKCDFTSSWEGAVRQAGLTDIRFHDLRHCFVSRLVAYGMSAAEIMRLSGHSTLSAFLIYANASQETVRKGATAPDDWHEQNFIQPINEMVN